MNYVDSFIKENYGKKMEAKIFKTDEGHLIEYVVDGENIKTEDFPGKSIHYATDAAENWLRGVKILNG